MSYISKEKKYINIIKLSRYGRFAIVSKLDIFKTDEVICKITDDHISIRRPDIDYRGKIIRPQYTNNNHNWMRITVFDDRLKIGAFEIDEHESNEDELIIYYNQFD